MTFLSVLDTVTRDAASRLGADRAILYVYDELAGGFSRAASLGFPGSRGPDPLDFAVQNSLLGALTASAPVALPSWGDPSARAFEGTRVVLLPLVAKQPIGVLVTSCSGTDSCVGCLDVSREAARQIEAALPGWRESPFAMLLESERTGVAVVEGPNYAVTHASASLRDIVDLRATPVVARSLVDALPWGVGDQIAEMLDVVRRSGVPSARLESEWTDAGGVHSFHYQVVPGAHPDSLIIAVWARGEAADTRRALEASILALQDSQSTLAAVLDNTNNGIFFIDPDLKVLYANRRMGEMFGIDTAATIGRDKREVIKAQIVQHMDDPQGFVARLSYLYAHMDEVATDEVIVARPARRILDRYSAPVHKEDGTLLGRIEVYSDVTEIRELQRNKDEFLSLVSHELRTPVTSIKGYAQLLRRRASHQPIAPRTATAYEAIERQTLRMQELIDTLLDLSRLEAGRLQLRFEKVDFTALSRHVTDMVQMTTEDHEIVLRIPPDPLWVRGDEQRLEQVMTNLLSNAVRYSDSGTRVVVDVATENDMIRASVTDEGIGIAPEALTRVFERFFRAEGVRESTGLGIGLYITRRFVEEHGGAISVRSDVGTGSTFTVRLPRLDGGSADTAV